jgi:hypothetical protein
MYAIKAIYDGNDFIPEEPVPVNAKYEVIITFIKPINSSPENILKYFNTWNEDDVNVINEIVEQRGNFTLNRDEI